MPGNKKIAGSSVSARELWLQAVKSRAATVNGFNKRGISTVKKTPNEFWIGTLRRSTGLQGEIANMDTFGSENRPPTDAVPFLSTSHYLRERTGFEKPPTKRSPSVDGRAPSGTPAYKTPEEYYDEVLELRRQISSLDKENGMLKAKMRRVEEDNQKKEKELEGLLDPTKSGDIRRTLTDRKPDSSAVVHSLKQKVLKLEQQVKDREQAYNALKSDIKATNLEEVRLKMEMFYQEIYRLQNVKDTSSQSLGPQKTARSSKSSKEGKELSSKKVKALNETILRMNEKNFRLTAENKTLKEDLEKLMSEIADRKEKQRDYEDMSRKQLTGVIAKLERQLDQQHTEQLDATDSRKPDTARKVTLDGDMGHRLEVLDKRENELLEEIKQLHSTISKLKEEAKHFREKTEEKGKEIRILKKEIADLEKELNLYKEKDVRNVKPSSARASPVERPHKSDEKNRSDSLERNRERKDEHERGDMRNREHVDERSRRLKELREISAARTIQRSFRGHNEEQTKAAVLIQSVIRGNQSRKQQMSHFKNEEVDEGDLSDAAELIQSAVRGHWNRKLVIETPSRVPSAASVRSGTSHTRTSPRTVQSLDSAGEDDDASDDIITPRQRRRAAIKQQATPQAKSAAKPAAKPATRPHISNMADDDDDDDDIMF